ncbi:hypothetical protein GCM10027088_39310 [Nocardia goodfellowii]|uniref:Uncharacterized protein n=1 Tax=Nocardia goodfellowii TaxID=882446 RepID=A0ABS4QKH3_9NOCA|nr:hypothetical protein [Nocardia goodfellowii]
MRSRSRRHLAPVVMVSGALHEECAAAVTAYSALLGGGGFPITNREVLSADGITSPGCR